MDGRVIDAPWPIRFGIVHFGILPKRPLQSSEAYHSIWTEKGSPLIVSSRKIHDALQKRVTMPVELAMRYQNPSIDQAITNLADTGVNELLVIPLFPHYAMSSYETAVERVRSLAKEIAPWMKLEIAPPYYNDPDYIAALVASSMPHLKARHDHLLFSFHGLPERHLRKADKTGCHCMRVPNCCEVASPAHSTCYRAQCFKTIRAYVRATNLSSAFYSVAFQSRLGREPWMQPYTDVEIERLAQTGIKHLAVICPAFVSDCLETLEEIGIRGRETFRKAGGQELTLIPCLNDHAQWINALEKRVEHFQRGVQPNELQPSASAA